MSEAVSGIPCAGHLTGLISATGQVLTLTQRERARFIQDKAVNIIDTTPSGVRVYREVAYESRALNVLV